MSVVKSDEADWKEEANAVVRHLKQHVLVIEIADLPSSSMRIYFNLTTLEMKDFCFEMTPEGFRVVGESFDSNEKQGKYSVYETPYSMLDSLSPAYRDSFGEQLLQKLNKLKEEQSRHDASDPES